MSDWAVPKSVQRATAPRSATASSWACEGADRGPAGVHVREIALVIEAIDLELAEGRGWSEERERRDRGHQDHGQAPPSQRQRK